MSERQSSRAPEALTEGEIDRIDSLIQEAGILLSSLHELAEMHERDDVTAFTVAVKSMTKEGFRTLDNALMLLQRSEFPPMGVFVDEDDYPLHRGDEQEAEVEA